MPPGLVNGLFFPFLVKWVAEQRIDYPVHKVYITETVGFAAGGMAFIGLIVLRMNGADILNLTAATLIIIAGICTLKNRLSKLLAVFGGVSLFIVMSQYILPEILTLRWSPYSITEIRESPHQAVTALSYDDNLVLFSNNEPLWSCGIEENAEELVHFGMLNHPAPHKILIVGPVNRDIITQLEKYPSTETVTSVQSDKVLADMLLKYSGPDFAGKVELHQIIDDPLKFLRRAETCYDVVILNVPLPVNAMWNVYYSREFFTLLKSRLTDLSVLSLQFPGSETYLNDYQLQFLKVMENTVRSVFKHYVWIPGETLHLLAANRPLYNSFEDIGFELKFRTIDNRYIQENYLWDRLSAMKIGFLNDQLARSNIKRINSITKPIGFYFNTVLWDQQAGGLLKSIYARFWGKSPVLPAVIIGGIILFLLIIFYPQKRSAALSKLNMALVGFSIMSLESVVLITLQSFAGALYLRVAFLSMAFMIGAAAGAAWQRRSSEDSNSRQLTSALFILLLISLIYGLLLNHESAPLSYAGFHYAVLFLSGFAGGLIFPILSYRVRQQRGITAARAAGGVYAWDIFGACLGVYLTSGLIIPVYGLMPALWLLVTIISLLLAGQVLQKN